MKRVAAMLSVVGHPFVVAPLTVALMVRQEKLAVVIVLCMVAAMLAVIAWRVARGRWSDYDVSDPQQRHGFYPIALVVVAIAAAASWFLRMPAGFVRGMIFAGAMLAAGALLTRITKVSLHVMIGMFCAVIASDADLRATLALGVLALAVAWSRVVLGRHTIAQVCIGAASGGLFGALLVAANRASWP